MHMDNDDKQPTAAELLRRDLSAVTMHYMAAHHPWFVRIEADQTLSTLEGSRWADDGGANAPD